MKDYSEKSQWAVSADMRSAGKGATLHVHETLGWLCNLFNSQGTCKHAQDIFQRIENVCLKLLMLCKYIKPLMLAMFCSNCFVLFISCL